MKLRPKIKHADSIPAATMADIAFLLIIFFMLATSFTRDRQNINLPHSILRHELPHNSVALTIDQNNQIFWNGSLMSWDDIQDRVSDTLTRDKYRPFIIKADRYVKYTTIDRILQILTNAGVVNLSLPTKAEKED